MASGEPFEPYAPQALHRYLPPDLADAIQRPAAGIASSSYKLEAFVHLAAARYSVSTYLPRLLLQRLLDGHEQSPWLEWIEGTLLFADLSGSTALAERLAQQGREGTERVTNALNQIFTSMIAQIESYGGDLLTFGGDALLVLFNDGRHPRTAARAALALQHALEGYKHTIPGIGSFPMRLHIGLESGPIALASAGLEHDRHCFALGATVNRVAAVEAAAGPGEVVVGPRAAAELQGFVTGVPIEPNFLRLMSITPARAPHPPLPEQPPITVPPDQAIPALIEELRRVSPYVPPVLLERIIADPQRPLVEAELRPVTVLFAQVTGLETLAEQVPPAEAAQAIQHYIAAAQEAVERFGGVVNKLDIADEGVKLIAIFGAPTAYEDHTERAALAALEMRSRVQSSEFRIQNDSTQPLRNDDVSFVLRQRIGLNLGVVFAGNVGSATRKEYTVIGDAVNVAARVMNESEWGEIWCSAAVANTIQARLLCEARGSVAVKGKTRSLELFRVSARREAQPEEAPALGPLIGRKRELDWLREHLQATAQGNGRSVRVLGEAGVGKSRLLAALLEEADAADFRVITATCFSYTAGIPYAAWSEWLRAYCGIRSGDDNAQRIGKLAAALGALGPDMEEWLPVLADLARLDVAENRLTRGLDAKLRQERRFELLETMLLHAATQQPVLVLFEDLHWADPISLELWQRIAAKLENNSVLLIGAHRQGLALPEEHTYVLRLGELSTEESSALVTELSDAASLPKAVLHQIVTRAAGNPLFLHELILAVQERFQPSAFSLQPSAVQSAIEELPDSLNGLLLARIDQLDETSRTVLRVASVIGQRIPFGVLRALQSQEQEALIRQLLRLDEHELTQLERLEPERIHIFRHALVQEVAYQSMLYARRRELHGRIGAYLERRYADNLDDYVGLIAHHYRLSDQREKAIDYLLLAGRAAGSVYANEEAIQSFQWALDALHDQADSRTWIARDALGDVFATVGRYDDALAQHTAILAAPNGTPEARRKAHAKRGAVLEKQGHYAAALEELDQAMQIARSGAEEISPLAVPSISADIGLVHQRRGEYDQAIAACQQGLLQLKPDSRTREDEQIEARLHLTLGAVYGMRGDYPRARQHFEHSLAIREIIDDLPGLVATNNNLGYLSQLQSNYSQALEHYSIAESIAAKIGFHAASIFAGLNRAYAFINLGQYEHSVQLTQNVLQLAVFVKDLANSAQCYTTLGVAQFHIGNYEQALEAYDQALEIHRQLGSAYQIANVLMNKANVFNALAQYPEAQSLAQAALEQANVLQAQRLKAESMNALAQAYLGLGDLQAARLCNQEALATATSVASKHDTGTALRIQGQICAALGLPFQESFEASLQLFHEVADRFEIGRSLHSYARALRNTGEESLAATFLKQAQTAFSEIEAHGELRRISLDSNGSN